MGPNRTTRKNSLTSSDNRVEVILLGTYHMANPGLDMLNIEADDVLSDGRQQELSDLTVVLKEWHPDAVAVEIPAEQQDNLNTLYKLYRSFELSYDKEIENDSALQDIDNPVSDCRSEVIQVGFRLADKLGHEDVYAVDYPMQLTDDLDEDELADIDDPRGMLKRAQASSDVELSNPQQIKQEAETHLKESTLIEHFRFINRKEQLGFNHELQFALALAGVEQQYVGSRMLSTWYERNIRIVENLWRAIPKETNRVLLLIGDGHVNALEHLLSETPMFQPRSALTILDNGV